MKHELLLVLAISVTAATGFFMKHTGRGYLKMIPVILFAIVTVAGFFPVPDGMLFGGIYLAAPMPGLMKNILNSGTLIILLQSYPWFSKPQNSEKTAIWYILIMTSLLGMDLMLSSGHFLTFYTGLELATLPLAALGGFTMGIKGSKKAAIKLLLASILSTGLLLYGLSMIFGASGSLHFSDLLKMNMRSTLHLLGFFFFFAGIAVKISIAPFHLWTADIYEGSSSGIASFISVIFTGAVIFILVIILYSVFPSISVAWQKTVFAMSILTITAGNIYMLLQKNIKRFLAYSTVSQAGYILAGIIGISQTAMASVVWYIIIYAFSNLALFGVAASISNATGKENISDYQGFARTNPKLGIAMVLALLSLAGVPPLAGFFSKFFVFAAGAEKGFFFLLLIIALNSVFSLSCYLRIVRIIVAEKGKETVAEVRIFVPESIALIICVAGIILAGFAGFAFEYIRFISFGI